MKEKELSLKPSPVAIVKKLFVIEILLAIIVVLTQYIGDFLVVYEQLPFSDSISSTFFAVSVLAFLQIIFLISIFLSWYFESYEVYRDRIVHKKGVLFKSNDIRPFKSLTSIREKEGILGKWLNYASIELEDSRNGQLILIPDIFKASEEVQKIRQIVTMDEQFEAEESHELEELLKEQESKTLEFKASLRWDNKQGAVNKDLEVMIIKSLAAFMNSDGGKLVIGVDDQGKVVGLKNDLNSVKRKNRDGFENHFTTLFSTMIGAEYSQFYQLAFEELKGKLVCIITAQKADEPVYVKSNGDEKFYIRSGNSTRELNVREALKYIRNNFESYNTSP